MSVPFAKDKLAGRRRQQIIEGARICFARTGFHAATVEDLERACGLTRGTLFKYFRSKADMLSAVVAQEMERRKHLFERLIKMAQSLQSLDTLIAAVVTEQRMLSREDPWGLRLRLELKSLSETDPELGLQIDTDERNLRKWRRELIARLQQQGMIHPEWDVEVVTDLISVLILGLSVESSYALPRKASDVGFAETCARILARSLSEPPGPD